MQHLFWLVILLAPLALGGQSAAEWSAQDNLRLQEARGQGSVAAYRELLTDYLAYRKNNGPLTVELANVYHQASREYTGAGLLQLALAYNDTATDLRIQSRAPWAEVAQTYYQRGVIYFQLGAYAPALDAHERAIVEMDRAIAEVGLEANIDLARRQGYFIQRSALTAIWAGNYELAELRLAQVPYYLELFPKASTEIDMLTNLGDLAQNRKQFAESVARYEVGLVREAAAGLADREKRGVLNNNMAFSLSQLGRYDEANALYQRALEDIRRTTNASNTGENQAVIHSYILLNDAKRGEFDGIEAQYQAGLAAGRSFYRSDKGPSLGELHLRRMEAEMLRGDFAAAQAYYQPAVNALMDEPRLYGPAELPVISGATIYGDKLLLELLAAKRNAYVDEHDAGTRADGLELALATSLTIDTLLRRNRDQLSLTAGLGQFNAQEAGNYHAAVEVALRLYHASGDEAYLARAYQFVSGQKSNLLRRYLTSPGLARGFGVPDTVIERITELEVAVLVTENGLRTADPDIVDSLRRALLLLNRDLTQQRRRLATDQPAFTRALRGYGDLDLAAATASLSPEQLVVEYYFTTDSLYAFTLSAARGLEYQSLPYPDDLQARIPEIVAGGAAAGAGYVALLAPLLDGRPGVTRLQIIPDGLLWKLPFAALRRDGRFLIEDYSISYAYASPLLFDETLRAEYDRDKERYLGYGISYDDLLRQISANPDRSAAAEDVRSMGVLPFADREVRTAAAIIGGSFRLNEAATKASFLAEATTANVLHLSMHGLLRDDPTKSGLVFPGQGAEFDLLTMGEVMRRRFPSLLTVLSACHTGKGPLETSEGMLSIGRAFTAAGSAATITSTWEARDEATHDILIRFYEALATGQAKDVALQTAVTTYLANESAAGRSPRNWANLTLTGSVAPLPANNGSLVWWVIGGVVLLLLSAVAWRR